MRDAGLDVIIGNRTINDDDPENVVPDAYYEEAKADGARRLCCWPL